MGKKRDPNRIRCSAKTRGGSRCKRTVEEDEQFCHLHLRRNRANEAKKDRDQAKVVSLFGEELQRAVEEYKYNPTELAAWLRQVRMGELYVTTEKVTGGDGKTVELREYPDWDTKLKAAALEERVGRTLGRDSKATPEEIAEAIADALFG